MSTSLIRRLTVIAAAVACLAAIAGTADAKPLKLKLPMLIANTSAGDAVSLNPQPLPPKVGDTASHFGGVMLNPQPLPPKAGLQLQLSH